MCKAGDDRGSGQGRAATCGRQRAAQRMLTGAGGSGGQQVRAEHCGPGLLTSSTSSPLTYSNKLTGFLICRFALPRAVAGCCSRLGRRASESRGQHPHMTGSGAAHSGDRKVQRAAPPRCATVSAVCTRRPPPTEDTHLGNRQAPLQPLPQAEPHRPRAPAGGDCERVGCH